MYKEVKQMVFTYLSYMAGALSKSLKEYSSFRPDLACVATIYETASGPLPEQIEMKVESVLTGPNADQESISITVPAGLMPALRKFFDEQASRGNTF